MRSSLSYAVLFFNLFNRVSADFPDQLAAYAVRVYSTGMAFLALKRNGSEVTWGSSAMAAPHPRAAGSVVTWGGYDEEPGRDVAVEGT